MKPLDAVEVRRWLQANPDWAASGPAARLLAPGRPVPRGVPARAVPPELAVLLPLFPGYRYLAVGPDLALVGRDGAVASILPGAFRP
ncbi:hypothetical protein [Paracraurococcus ruber]|uniref:hypothetical protein n=1 Tax=Paracraurococcus ruber TaxID=77675 RepID=UPI00130518E5|nr:hypothetical protein [Paracraurococcus ruber]